METLPSNPARLKLALMFWVVFSVVFIGVLVYRSLVGPRDTLWIGFSGVLSVAGIWRVILTARHRDSPEGTA